jgi:F0F1-type ATP synthase delta subunit
LSEVFDLKIEKDRSILFKTNKSIVGGIVISISDKRNTIINLTKVGGKLNDSKDNKVKS